MRLVQLYVLMGLTVVGLAAAATAAEAAPPAVFAKANGAMPHLPEPHLPHKPTFDSAFKELGFVALASAVAYVVYLIGGELYALLRRKVFPRLTRGLRKRFPRLVRWFERARRPGGVFVDPARFAALVVFRLAELPMLFIFQSEAYRLVVDDATSRPELGVFKGKVFCADLGHETGTFELFPSPANSNRFALRFALAGKAEEHFTFDKIAPQ